MEIFNSEKSSSTFAWLFPQVTAGDGNGVHSFEWRGPTGKFSFKASVDADGNVFERIKDPYVIGKIADEAEREKLAGGSGKFESAVCVSLDPDSEDIPGTYSDKGFVILKSSSPQNPHHYLLLPTAPISGIEDPHSWGSKSANYFADAWVYARADTAASMGLKAEELPRDTIALAVNSMDYRSQDRLHIHSAPLVPALKMQLEAQLELSRASAAGEPEPGAIRSGKWTPLDFTVHGHDYSATWVEGDRLNLNPFSLVFEKLSQEHGGGAAGDKYAGTHMDEQSILVVAEKRQDGQEGFLIIDGCVNQNPLQRDGGSAEEWLQSGRFAAGK